jgi:hypothetical protein
MFVNFYRCALIFKATEPFKNLPLDHSRLSKGSFDVFRNMICPVQTQQFYSFIIQLANMAIITLFTRIIGKTPTFVHIQLESFSLCL